MLYTVKLVEFNTDEIVIIDLCMQLCHFDSKRAFECVDNMPYILADSLDMEKAKDMREAFEKEGAIIDVVPMEENSEFTEDDQDAGTYKSPVSIEDTFKESKQQVSKSQPSEEELSNPYEELSLKNKNQQINSLDNNVNKEESLVGRTSYGGDSLGAGNPHQGESLAGRTSQGGDGLGVGNPYQGESLAGRTSYGEKNIEIDKLFGEDRLPLSPSYLNNELLGNTVYGAKKNSSKLQENNAKREVSSSKHVNERENLKKKDISLDKLEVDEEDTFEISDNESGLEIELEKPPQEILSQDNNVLNIGAAYDENCMQINTEQYSDKNTSSSSEDMKRLFKQKAKKPVDTIESDDLFDLSKLGIRNKPQNTNAYEREQVVCPNCGSTFVSSKKSQGLFGTGKIKFVCEACKTKF